MNKTTTGLIAAKRIAVAVATVCATLAAPAYATDDVKNVLDLMLKKGVISQQDYDQFMKDNADAAENKQFKEQRLDKDISKANAFIQKNAEAGQVMKNGLGIQSSDGQHSIALTGRVHADYRQFDANNSAAASDPHQDKFEVRRARLGVKGQLFKDFKYEIIGDFGIASSSSVGTSGTSDSGMSNQLTGTDVAYLDYAYDPAFQVRVGRFKMPFSLEQLTSSNNMDFMERSLAGQVEGEIIPAKETGMMFFGSPQSGLSYALAMSRGRTNKSAVYDKPDFVGRVTANFAELSGNKDLVTHLGIGYSVGEVTAVTPASSNTEARASSGFFGGTALAAGSSRVRTGIEMALAYDAFKLQSEYFNIKYEQPSGVEPAIKANYVQALWNITGEKHNYSNSSGTFGWIKPKSAFTKSGGTGAWQLGLRVSDFNGEEFTLGSGKVSGATATTIGLTWFMNDNVRVMANYVQTKFPSAFGTGGAARTSEDAFMLRGQFSF